MATEDEWIHGCVVSLVLEVKVEANEYKTKIETRPLRRCGEEREREKWREGDKEAEKRR